MKGVIIPKPQQSEKWPIGPKSHLSATPLSWKQMTIAQYLTKKFWFKTSVCMLRDIVTEKLIIKDHREVWNKELDNDISFFVFRS